MVTPKPEQEGDEKLAARVPDFSIEADVVHVFEDHNTLGDDRYPPVRRPAVYPVLLSPDSPVLNPHFPKQQP